MFAVYRLFYLVFSLSVCLLGGLRVCKHVCNVQPVYKRINRTNLLRLPSGPKSSGRQRWKLLPYDLLNAGEKTSVSVCMCVNVCIFQDEKTEQCKGLIAVFTGRSLRGSIYDMQGY